MIKNLIFDFGAVLLPIDEEQTWKQFEALGAHQDLRLKKNIFQAYETGEISTVDFLHQLKNHFSRKPFKQDLSEGWNALLFPLPEENVRLLKKLRKQYRLFLLSNTNHLHVARIKKEAGPFLYRKFCRQFEKVYYSHEVGMRKPDPEIFEFLLEENQLEPAETFFVDDNEQNIEAARDLGIRTWLFNPLSDNVFDIQKIL